jgi:hypothetical protein
MRYRAVLVGGFVVGCCLVAGCSASGGGASTSDSIAVQRAPVAPNGANVPGPTKQSGGTAASGSGSTGSGGTSQAVDPLPATGRQVIRTASITLSVPNVTRTAADVRSITAGVGGYAGSENTRSDQADFTLQVPTTTLDQVLDRIAALGKVTDRGEQAQDVTKQLVDVRSRVVTQQASVDRVRALLAKATTVGDVVTIEGELATREANLESLEQQQAELSAQVAMSTVMVHIGQSHTTPPPPPPAAAAGGGFVGGLSAGWHSFVAVLRGVVMVFGALLPYLLGFGVPAALVWWYVRRRRAGRPQPAPVSPDAG